MTLTEQNFYNSYEVIIFNKMMTELFQLELSISMQSKADGNNDNNNINNVWSTLNFIISKEKQEAETILSATDLKNFEEVLFIIVSIIDEFFVRKEKHISEYWSKNLFEYAYFNTRNSGDVFFERVSEIIENKVLKKKSILYAYLMAMCYGFRGKYFGKENEKLIHNFKRIIYGIIFEKNSISENSRTKYNFTEKTETIEKRSITLSNNVFRYKISILIILLYIFGSYFVFYKTKINLDNQYEKINNSMEYILK